MVRRAKEGEKRGIEKRPNEDNRAGEKREREELTRELSLEGILRAEVRRVEEVEAVGVEEWQWVMAVDDDSEPEAAEPGRALGGRAPGSGANHLRA